MRHKKIFIVENFLHVGLVTVILVISRPFSSKNYKKDFTWLTRLRASS